MKKTVLLIVLALMTVTASAAQNEAARGTGWLFAAGTDAPSAPGYPKEKKTSSGDGVRHSVECHVDAGAGNYPLSLQELEKIIPLKLPTLVGGIAPVLDVPSIKPGLLRSTETVLPTIFSERATRWSELEIQTLTPSLSVPDLTVTCVVRADAEDRGAQGSS
jgi:phosphate transport system substrate-binding protein